MTDEPDDPVGYGKPPRHTQFKPGQSGNPSGRPKGVRSLKDDFHEVLCEPVRITQNGKARELTTQQVILKVLANKAGKGEMGAIRQTVELMLRVFGTGEDAEAERGALSEDDEALIAAALAREKTDEGDIDG